MKDRMISENRQINPLVFSVLGLPFVQAMNITKPIKRKSPKIGRNEMCNCGCGFKRKFCPLTRKD